jgi:SMC interacting uncharacterized protein involved in chromosome segregation
LQFEKLSASGALYKSTNYPFLLSSSKALLSTAKGHEWIVFRGSHKRFLDSIAGDQKETAKPTLLNSEGVAALVPKLFWPQIASLEFTVHRKPAPTTFCS